MAETLSDILQHYLDSARQASQDCHKNPDLCATRKKIQQWLGHDPSKIPFSEIYGMRTRAKQCCETSNEPCRALAYLKSAAELAAKEFMTGVRP